MSADDSLPALSDPGTPQPAARRGQEGEAVQHSALAGPGDQAERYERQGLLGEGGMGVVHVARDRRLRRQVALKVAARPEHAARLATEAWITAQLEHPGVVAVYDAGETDGQAWYTMRLIRGRTLQERVVECADLGERLALLPHFTAACQAVAYAHAMGIIHRDLKPSNIMVGEFGETQVADWGLARPVDELREDWARIISPQRETPQRKTPQRKTPQPKTTSAGTPRYMSPEQARRQRASRASDVYCLGAALFELLSGEPPPAEPGRGPDLARVPPDVPVDLVAIARHALAPDPRDRYPSAVELAADLERWQAGGRVRAHDYRPTELLQRLLTAWRAPLGVAAIALLVVAAVGVVAARRTAAERAIAQANYAEALSQQARSALLDGRLPEAQVLAAHVLAQGPSPLARGVIAATGLSSAERLDSTPLPPSCVHAAVVSPDARRLACFGDARVEVRRVADLALLWSQDLHALERPAWLGQDLAVATESGLVWASEQGVQPLHPERFTPLAGSTGTFALRGSSVSWARPGQPSVAFDICGTSRVAVAPVGDTLAVGCSDGVLRRYGPTGEQLAAIDLGGRPKWSRVHARGDELLVGRLDGSVQTVDLQTGAISSPLAGLVGSVRSLLPVPDSTLVLVRGERGGPRVWNTAVNAWVGALPAGASSLAAGPASREVLLLGERLDAWRLPPAMSPVVRRFGAGVAQVTISQRGDELGVALGSGEVVRQAVADGRELGRQRLSSGVAKAVAFTADGGLAAAAMGVPAVVLQPDGKELRLGEGAVLRRLGWLADGRLWGLIYGHGANTWDGRTGQERGGYPDIEFFDGSSSEDGSAALFADDTGGIWRLSGERWEQVARDPDVVAVDVGAGGSPLVWARRRELCIDGHCTAVEGELVDVALSHGLVALSTISGDVWLLDVTTAEPLALLQGHSGLVSSVEFSPEGDWLASASWDGTVRRWDLSALHTPAAELLEGVQARWGLSLQEALRSR